MTNCLKLSRFGEKHNLRFKLFISQLLIFICELFSGLIIFQAYHVGRITGLDICVRKPILVTCGVDKTVRVWNYHEKTCEIMKFFHEDAFSVALHPSGNFIYILPV